MLDDYTYLAAELGLVPDERIMLDGAIDAAGNKVDDATGGKHGDKIQSGGDKAGEYLDGLSGEQDAEGDQQA